MSNSDPMTAARSIRTFSACACGSIWALASAAATPLTVNNVDLSGDQPNLAAAVPVVAVDPSRKGRVAVAWRFIDPLGGSNAHSAGNWACHLSISEDDGKTFKDQAIDWGLDTLSRCNAPWAGFSRRGDLYLAGTLTGSPPAHAVGGAPSEAAAVQAHPEGTAGFKVSHDGGRMWSATVSVIPSNALERFETDASIPLKSKQVPWDGARGAVDLSSGTIYLSGAFPARPGGEDHSQRFYSASADGGKTFGPIRAFGSAVWPERWDGDIAAAHGNFIVSYIGASAPDAMKKCPCAVIAISHDAGRTLVHQLVAEASEFDLDTLVHYPEIAADPAHKNRFALVLVSADKSSIAVHLTANAQLWTRLTIPPSEGVVFVTRPAVAFSPTGVLVVAWRGTHADGSYDLYAAGSADGKKIDHILKVSTEASRTPGAWRNTYALRGDFHTSVAADDSDAHAAWADARNGADVRAYYARVPLRALTK